MTDQQTKNRDQRIVNFLKKTKTTLNKGQPSSISLPKPKGSSITPASFNQNCPYLKLDTTYGMFNDHANRLLPIPIKISKKESENLLYRSLDEQYDDLALQVFNTDVSNMSQINWKEGELHRYSPIKQTEMKRYVVSSLDNKTQKSDPFRSAKRKLYEITFNNNLKPKEKHRGNAVSVMKISELQEEGEEELEPISVKFDTFYEFKNYMKKLAMQSREKKQSEVMPTMTATSESKQKKCIIPALLPNSNFKPKKSIERSINPYNLTSLHHQILAKKAQRQKAKQLIIQSKKQELIQNLNSKSKPKRYRLSNNREDRNEQEKQINSERKNQSSNHSIQQQFNRKSRSPSKLSQLIKDKRIKNIPYLLNGNSEKNVYQQKIDSYRQFLFIVNFAHRVFDPLNIVDQNSLSKQQKNSISKYLYFVGPGNNSMLIRSLMKRRIWWSETKNINESNFVWTQLKVQSIFEDQMSYNPVSILMDAQNEEDCSLNREYKEDFLSNAKQNHKKSSSLKNIFTIEKCTLEGVDQTQQTSKEALPKGLMFKAPFAFEEDEKILTKKDSLLYKKMLMKIPLNEMQNYQIRLKYLPKTFLVKKSDEVIKVHNHFQFNHSLGNKKALLHHLQLYYKLTNQPQDKAFPPTYHIRQGQNDQNFQLFLAQYKKITKERPYLKNIWILKPGENSNRGKGITVIKDLREIKKKLNQKQKYQNGECQTFILQKYIERPLLYMGRKFDIRHYMVITGLYGKMRAYFYGEGYVRTSSYFFNLDDIKDPAIHLTNDAVQKYSEDYGAYQEGNKVSYNHLQKYYSKYFPQKKFNIMDIYKKMRQLAKDAVSATYVSLDPNRRLHNFEVFGLDFMIDEELQVYLIEVNTNPCLELSSSLLTRVIPSMLQQTFRVSLDALFPPPIHYSNNTKHLAPDCNLDKLQFQLLFDSQFQGQFLKALYSQNNQDYNSMLQSLKVGQFQADDVFEDEGQEIQVDNFI